MSISPFVVDLETVAITDAETYLEPVKAPDNYKDPLKIAAYCEDARLKQVENAALDIDLARIIALGIHRPGYPTDVLTVEERTEADILAWLWERWNSVPYEERRLVTFNGLGYDVPLLLRRSLYLGVPCQTIQVDRFKHPQVIDLQAVLSLDGKLKWHSLQFYLQRFGYPKGGTDITGADVAQAYREGRWDLITGHCRSDVDGTKWLAERIGAIPRVSEVAAALDAAF